MDMNILYKAIIVATALLIGLGSTYILKMKQDNPLEQISEVVIKEETGLDIDLTPTSK